MDDGNSWIGILLFAASVAVFYLIYGFGAAIQALDTSALEDERDEGNKKAAALLRIQEDPGKFVRTNQVVTCFFTLALGAFTLPQTAGYIRRFLAVKLAMAPGLAAGPGSGIFCGGLFSGLPGSYNPQARGSQEPDPVLL